MTRSLPLHRLNYVGTHVTTVQTPLLGSDFPVLLLRLARAPLIGEILSEDLKQCRELTVDGNNFSSGAIGDVDPMIESHAERIIHDLSHR